jgi:hypothetical protein
MPTHMVLEFPLLFASGWFVADAASPLDRWLARIDPIDVQGLLGVTFAACALTLWMIPTALDLALMSDPVRWGKYVSLWLAGLLLRRSQARLRAELSIFFIGMLAWMLATVGLVFQTMPRRLCVNYLLDEQRWTGAGLVCAAVLLGTLGLWGIVVNQSSTAPGDEIRALDRPWRGGPPARRTIHPTAPSGPTSACPCIRPPRRRTRGNGDTAPEPTLTAFDTDGRCSSCSSPPHGRRAHNRRAPDRR